MRLRRALMVVQVAVSVVLLVAAGLFGRTLRELHRIDVGFSRENLLLFRIDATPAGYQPEKFPALHRRLTETIAALPGVRSLFFEIGIYDPARVEAASHGGEPLPFNHSPAYAPVPEPTLRTGVKAMSLAVLEVLAG